MIKYLETGNETYEKGDKKKRSERDWLKKK